MQSFQVETSLSSNSSRSRRNRVFHKKNKCKKVIQGIDEADKAEEWKKTQSKTVSPRPGCLAPVLR